MHTTHIHLPSRFPVFRTIYTFFSHAYILYSSQKQSLAKETRKVQSTNLVFLLSVTTQWKEFTLEVDRQCQDLSINSTSPRTIRYISEFNAGSDAKDFQVVAQGHRAALNVDPGSTLRAVPELPIHDVGPPKSFSGAIKVSFTKSISLQWWPTLKSLAQGLTLRIFKWWPEKKLWVAPLKKMVGNRVVLRRSIRNSSICSTRHLVEFIELMSQCRVRH